jgi:hypothetical protein
VIPESRSGAIVGNSAGAWQTSLSIGFRPEHSLPVAFGDLLFPLEILAKARGDFRKNLRLNGCRSWTGVG